MSRVSIQSEVGNTTQRNLCTWLFSGRTTAELLYVPQVLIEMEESKKIQRKPENRIRVLYFRLKLKA